jgi:hypothetical protein
MIITKLQAMVNLIQIWIANNRLFINNAKTKIMIVNPRNWCKSIAKMPHVQFGPYSVEVVRDFKLLGVSLDEHLIFQKMADATKRKVHAGPHQITVVQSICTATL